MFTYQNINIEFGWNGFKLTRDSLVEFFGETYIKYGEEQAMMYGCCILGDLQIDYYKDTNTEGK